MVIYLASQSPRRRAILKQMRLRFKTVKSSYHEKPKKMSPARLVIEHAVGKVRGARIFAKQGLVLGSDTIVYCGGKVLGKPKTVAEAARMLRMISNRSHYVYSGVALLNLSNRKIVKGYERTRVFIRKLYRSEILSYIRRVNSLDKAGAYAIQMKPFIVEKIEGSRSNVVGLPKGLVKELMQQVVETGR